MKISVIVPVYNGELYIEKCITSILEQTYTEFELILVNDGSTDHSGTICEKFANKDRRIKVVHKKNGGLISARITGIEEAKGKWISFVDSDDWIDTFFLERMINVAEKSAADIVISGCISENSGVSEKITNLIPSGIYEENELEMSFIPKMLYYQGFYQFGILPYMCNKIFNREILKKCYENIDTKIYDGEDVAVVYPYILYSKRIAVIDECMYHYRIHEKSMTFQKKKGFYENVSRLYIHLYKIFSTSKYYEVMLPQLNQYMRLMIWIGIPEENRKKEGYLFPFEKVPYGSDVILYGAGAVGIEYYQQLKRSNYCNIVTWVDRNYLGMAGQGFLIESPNMISFKKYDYIVIANIKEEIRKEIKEFLLEMGISENKIIMGEEVININ